MPKEEMYNKMLMQAKEMRAMANSFIETIEPYTSEYEGTEAEGEYEKPSEDSDINYPEGREDKGPKLALVIEAMKKNKKK